MCSSDLRLLLTKPMRHESPMFATRFWHALPDVDMRVTQRHGPPELLGIIGNHGNYQKLEHVEAPACYALMRITGINSANRLGLMGRKWYTVEFENGLDSRFVGY